MLLVLLGHKPPGKRAKYKQYYVRKTSTVQLEILVASFLHVGPCGITSPS